MDEVFKNIIGTIVRSVLALVGGYLVSAGLVSDGQVQQIIGGLAVFLVAVIWGIINKYVWKKQVDTALELPAGSSVAKLQDVLKNK